VGNRTRGPVKKDNEDMLGYAHIVLENSLENAKK
jgi:hypothetical protein